MMEGWKNGNIHRPHALRGDAYPERSAFMQPMNRRRAAVSYVPTQSVGTMNDEALREDDDY
ncbi:hypothetical protein KQI65_13605 [bacterium]|nr:hypothetical protein [bacterium]